MELENSTIRLLEGGINMSSAREWFESLPKPEFEQMVICPKCGELFVRQSPDAPCRFCGHDNVVPVTQPDEKEYRDGGSFDERDIREENLRSKYVDQTSPIFDRELYLKRQAKDEAEYREIRATFSNDTGTYVPRCPTCGSPDLIYYGSNGVGGDWARNQKPIQYSCKNCGYRW